MRRLREVAGHLPAEENSKPVPFYLQSGFLRAEHLLMVSLKNQKIGLPRSIPVTHGHTLEHRAEGTHSLPHRRVAVIRTPRHSLAEARVIPA